MTCNFKTFVKAFAKDSQLWSIQNIAIDIGYNMKKNNQASLIKYGNKENIPFLWPWKCQKMYMFSGGIKGNTK